MSDEIDTAVFTVALPLVPPTPSKITVCDDNGTCAPPLPPLVNDQLAALFQLFGPAPDATQ